VKEASREAEQRKKPPTDGCRGRSRRKVWRGQKLGVFFYIFIIITEATRSISTIIKTYTNLSSMSRGAFIYTTFAYVARQISTTRWRSVSSGCKMSSLPLISSSLLPLRQLGLAAPLIARWAPTGQIHLPSWAHWSDSSSKWALAVVVSLSDPERRRRA